MKRDPIAAGFFAGNRARLAALLKPNALAAVNASDLLPASGDALLPMRPDPDLFYLTGIEQEESLLLLFPHAADPTRREMLFVREPDEKSALWEGDKLTKAEAETISGISSVHWLSEFPAVFRQMMIECELVYLNRNEHPRAAAEVETREDRFTAGVMRRYPLHEYRRLAPLLHGLRLVKDACEVSNIRDAIQITRQGFLRALKVTHPGVNEAEIEAEFAHEFTRQRARFAYPPIVASGARNSVLHYSRNDAPCRRGDLVLIDIGAAHRNYNADMTRTIPVSGRFTRRQRKVYDAVLRVLREVAGAMTPGNTMAGLKSLTRERIGEELAGLGLLKPGAVKRKGAVEKYFMHGVSHPLGLDVHDVGDMNTPLAPGWVLTCEPAIYIREEGFGIRLENNILVTDDTPVDLMANIPIEPDEIESLMGAN